MDSKVKIEVLNRLLEAEISAIEYYQIHAESIAEKDIAEGIRSIIPAEESHAINLAARIRELGGEPIDASGDPVRVGKQLGEESKKQGTLGMLSMELENEQQAIKDYAIPVADILDDMDTIEMLEEQLFDEMRHAKWLKKTILELKGKF
ncbi:MAG: ferritin-like domain-containing protein [Desulfobacterales bacterium]|jgi:bacterioferritin (cytochrome b1)